MKFHEESSFKKILFYEYFDNSKDMLLMLEIYPFKLLTSALCRQKYINKIIIFI